MEIISKLEPIKSIQDIRIDLGFDEIEDKEKIGGRSQNQ